MSTKTRAIVSAADQLRAVKAAVEFLPARDRVMPDELLWSRQVSARVAEVAAGVDWSGMLNASGESFDERFAEYVEAWSRHQAAEALVRSNFAARLGLVHEQRVRDLVPKVLARLVPVAQEAAGVLTEVAPGLPAGAGALDPAAVVAGDAMEAYKAARGALHKLMVMAEIHRVTISEDVKRRGGVSKGVGVAAIVAVDTGLEPTRRLADSRRVLDPELAAANEAVMGLPKAWAADALLTLVDVARGAYPGATIELAATEAEATARADALVKAGLNEMVDFTTLTPEAAQRAAS